MRIAPTPANETQRLEAVRNAVCAYAPREERFDRITRTLRRLMHVPIALITVVEEDEQWFRSVQGLDTDHTPRDISFCGHVVASGRPLIIRDTWAEPDFVDNPLVTGAPGIRSYVGWPLEIGQGLFAGSLCAIDTIPRVYSEDEFAGLRDLAHMAECELRAHAAASLQKNLLMRLDLMQRRHALDPVTGCWTIRGFRELLGLAVQQAHADGAQLALCHMRVEGMDEMAASLGETGRTSVLSVLAQLLRERLPPEGALARLSETEFCAMVPAHSANALEYALQPVMQPELEGVLPDGRTLGAHLACRAVRLSELEQAASASRFWGALLVSG
ncbi:MAG: GAF domain-containing protein [Burkholderiales bacterium]|nr:GAF domain-containing protein [Burkholderiales bacterium]